MWKCASRSFKIFRKTGPKRNTVLSTDAVQNEELHCMLKFVPGIINRCNSFSNIYRVSYEYFANVKKDREGPKEKKTKFLYGLKDCFIDALKWSGLIVFVGYYGVYYKRKSIFNIPDPYTEERFPRITGYYKALEYFIDTIGFAPYNCVFPEIQAIKSNKNKKKFVVESEAQNNEEKFSNLEEAHQKVLGAINNWLGIQCMQSGQKKKALQYFLQSAKEEHAPGIFNLGLCHEKGYGTDQSFSQAAELYQKASDLGHATAMYNLGVFYAKGLGGISLDVNHARKLFKAAALLGQADAIRALNLEKQSTGELSDGVLDPKCKEKEGNAFTLDQLVLEKFWDQSSCQSKENFSVCDDKIKTDYESYRYAERKELNSSLGSDSGVLDLSPHNEPFVLPV